MHCRVLSMAQFLRSVSHRRLRRAHGEEQTVQGKGVNQIPVRATAATAYTMVAMGTAVIVGAVGVFALHATGAVAFHIKPLMLGGVLLGGGIFGIGMGLLGYCPGTSVAACGEGRVDAVAGVAGQLVGAGMFVAAYAWLQPVMKLGSYGKVVFPDIGNSSPWLWVGAIAVVGLAAWYWGERLRPRARLR